MNAYRNVVSVRSPPYFISENATKTGPLIVLVARTKSDVGLT